jgi:hypothetical protein
VAGVTLATLISKARTRADMVGSDFVSDADVTEMLNSSWSELYEFLVGVFEDYFIAKYSFATVNGTDEYDLSAVNPGVFKIRGIDIVLSTASGNRIPLQPFQWSERDRYYAAVWGAVAIPGARRPAYREMGSKLKLLSPPDSAYSLELIYVPNCVPLDNTVPGTSDVLPVEVKPGWEEYIVIGAAAKMLAKEQNDVSWVAGEQERLKARIEGIAANRDADAPQRMVRRTRRGGDAYPYYFDDEDMF